MIKFKQLLNEAYVTETLHAKDIFNFYYLWYIALHSPEDLKTPFGTTIVDYYLGKLKSKYIKLFIFLMANQIQKYVVRGRIDPNFPKGQNLEGMSAEQLLELMKKTLRSDMKSRNEKWERVGEFLVNLSKTSQHKDIFLWINQLNNAIHNSNSRVLDKLPNYNNEIIRALDLTDKVSNIKALDKYVDKDIRELGDQSFEFQNGIREGLDKISMSPTALDQLSKPADKPASSSSIQPPKLREPEPKKDDDIPPELAAGPLQEVIDSLQLSEEDENNTAFLTGVKLAVNDKATHKSRNLNGYPEDFVRGYKTVKKSSWWDRVNAKLTNAAASLGKSYGSRF